MSRSIPYFAGAIAVTLAIAAFAAARGGSRAALYSAGGQLSGVQNGWAIAGDFMSANTFLGLTALYFVSGLDTAIYYLAPLAGFSLILLLLAEPLRRLGRYTLGDVLASRWPGKPMRVFSGLTTIAISVIYLIAQFVGAGALISILFGQSFENAVIIVGAMTAIYVAFGGMLAATWVQIVKAMLLVAAVIVLAALSLTAGNGLAGLYERAAAAHPSGTALFEPGGLQLDLFSSLSLTAGLVLGMAGMPHLLIRFFTVRDAAEARRSLVTASCVVGAVFAMLFGVVGPAAIAYVYGVSQFYGGDGLIAGGPNMIAMHLTMALGGEQLFGLIAAVAFATILAVVAGLTVAVSSAAAHDLYRVARPVRSGDERSELLVFRATAALTAALAVAFAIVFQRENVAFLTAMAFSVAASTSFPILILTLYWRRITVFGAMVGGVAGLISSIALIILGPAVWVKVLGNPQPVFPAEYPALVTAPLAFACAILASLMRRRNRAPTLAPDGVN